MLDQRKTISRRTLLRGAAIGGTGLLAAAVVGCGDDDEDTNGATQTTAPTAEPTATAATATMPPSEAKEFPLVAGWYRGDEVKYYDFGMNSATSANTVAAVPIWVLITGMDAQGNPQMVEGQHNIVDVKPGDSGYSDLWQVHLVTVPEDYEADTLRSREDVEAAGYEVTMVDMFVNCPIVPAGSALEGGEPLVQGWYKGEEVFYPDFGPNVTNAIPIWVAITGMDAQGDPQMAEGQMNIIDAVPADPGYSAFWRVNFYTVPADYQANTLKSAQDVIDSGYETTEADAIVNCPVTVF